MKKRTISTIVAVIATVVYSYNSFIADEHIVSGTNEAFQLPPRISEVQKTGIAPNSYIEAEVIKVTDGDTIDIKYKSKQYKVRLLCVDTPESVKTNVDVQPYGKEASDYTRQKVLDKEVKLIFDKGLRDRYNRLLAYVLVDDTYFLNADLVKSGYARVEIVSPNSGLSDYFKSLQKEAIQEKKGFWSLPERKQPFILNEKGNYVPRYWNDKKAS